MTLTEQRVAVKRVLFGPSGTYPNDSRKVLELAGTGVGEDFGGASEQVLAQFLDYFADHVIASRPLGHSFEELLDDLFCGDLPEDLLDDAAERCSAGNDDQSRCAMNINEQRAAVKHLVFGGMTHGEIVEWLYELGVAELLTRAYGTYDSETLTVSDEGVGRFMELVADNLLATRKRGQSPDDPLGVLLEEECWGDVDKARMARAVDRIDEAADRAVREIRQEV